MEGVKNNNVVHLTSAHQRHDTRVYLKECVSLARSGFNVTLIVADEFPNEVRGGVSVISVGKPRNRILRMILTTFRVYRKAILLDADLYHFHDPELIFTGLLLKRKGKKVIYDIHEMTRAQIKAKKWLPRFLRNIVSYVFSLVEDFSVGKFDALLVPQDEMKSFFDKKNLCETVFNYPQYEFDAPCWPRNKFGIIYSGSLGYDRGLMNCIGVIESLIRLDERYTLTLACKRTPEVVDAVSKSSACKNIVLAGYVPFDELLNYYNSASFGLILFNNVGQYYMANALKLFEYMGSGLVVVLPDFGEWPGFNEKYNVGLTVDVNNADSIASAIDSMSAESVQCVSMHNSKLVRDKFSWESEGRKLVKLYAEVLDESL